MKLRNNHRLAFFSFCIILIGLGTSCSFKMKPEVNTADKNATTETINLFNNLMKITEKGYMIGHQDDLAYGKNWAYQKGMSDVKEVCGDYPAVYGWDLGLLEINSPLNLDSVPFKKIKEYIIEVYLRGGVNTISWHANNPLTDGNTWDVSSSTVIKSILPGGQSHVKYKSWLSQLAIFFHSLKTENGTPVPVIFRPYHEFTGSWFWWGQDLCSDQEYISLWKFTTDYLRNEKQVHNLLMAYSPSDKFIDSKQFLQRYPGDDYVDLIGFDAYHFEGKSNDTFSELISDRLSIIEQIAIERNKLVAITETGYEQIPDSTWWTQVIGNTLKKHKLSYVLFWRNASNRPYHYYVPYAGHSSSEDFIKLYNRPETIFQSDLNNSLMYKKN